MEIVADNSDLLTEILIRLPAKPLLRFKSVSKQWRSIISSSSFSKLHYNNNNISSGVVLHRPSQSSLEFAFLNSHHHRSNLPPQFANNSVRILQSCNGLLLCSVRHGPHRRTLHILNPITSAFSSPPPELSDVSTWMNLVFDPAESHHYQLISILAFSNQIHRYSSATRTWHISNPTDFRPPFNSILSCGVYWRRRLHWLGPNSSDLGSIFLDVEHHKFGTMPTAIRRKRKLRQRSLEVSGGRLLLLEVYEEGEIRVLEIKEDYSGWEVRYEIAAAIDGVSEVYPEVFGRAFDGLRSKIYCKVQVCCVVDMVVVMRIPGKVLGFGLESRRLWEMKEVLPSSDSASDFEWLDVFPFVESLAFL